MLLILLTIVMSVGGVGRVGRIVSIGRIPLNHIHGLVEDLKTVVGSDSVWR